MDEKEDVSWPLWGSNNQAIRDQVIDLAIFHIDPGVFLGRQAALSSLHPIVDSVEDDECCIGTRPL